jgi:hypothetical protein
MALALVALPAPGFSFIVQHAQQIDLGFDTRDLAVVSFDLSAEQMTPERGRQFMLGSRKSGAVPGGFSGYAANAPLGGGFLPDGISRGDPWIRAWE